LINTENCLTYFGELKQCKNICCHIVMFSVCVLICFSVQFMFEALSTTDFRLKTHLFLSVLASNPHSDGIFMNENKAFWKCSPKWINLKAPFSHCRLSKWRHLGPMTQVESCLYRLCLLRNHFHTVANMLLCTLYISHSPAKMTENVLAFAVPLQGCVLDQTNACGDCKRPGVSPLSTDYSHLIRDPCGLII